MPATWTPIAAQADAIEQARGPLNELSSLSQSWAPLTSQDQKALRFER